jgi:hypothetical protein
MMTAKGTRGDDSSADVTTALAGEPLKVVYTGGYKAGTDVNALDFLDIEQRAAKVLPKGRFDCAAVHRFSRPRDRMICPILSTYILIRQIYCRVARRCGVSDWATKSPSTSTRFGRWPPGGVTPVNRTRRHRPFRQQSLQASVGERVAHDEFWQHAKTRSREQGRHHGVAVVHAQRP